MLMIDRIVIAVIAELCRLIAILFYSPTMDFYAFWSWSEISRYWFIVYIVAIVCWLLWPKVKGIGK